MPPVLFYNKDQTEVMAAVHLGKDLCGHPKIIHGGMIATLLDEILACVVSEEITNFRKGKKREKEMRDYIQVK